MPQTAAADENGPIGSSGLNYSYTTNNKTLTITGAGTMPDFTNDQPWKNHQGEIETVAIGDGVTSVGAKAFADCRKLTSVTLPASLTAVGGGAFLDCKALTDITVSWDDSHIPNINPSAFGDLTLEEIILHVPAGMTTAYRADTWDVWKHLFIMDQATIGDNFTTGVHWEYNDNTRTLRFTGAGAIPGFIGADDRPYMGIRKKLQAVTIDAGVTAIGRGSFYRCEALTSITLPAGVTTIGENAFAGCGALPSITLPAGLQTIGTNAFEHCAKLTSITLPAGVTTIGESAFQRCWVLTQATLPSSVQTIGNNAFTSCLAMTDITVGWTSAAAIPDISSLDVFDGITRPDVTLHVPAGMAATFGTKDIWKDFHIVAAPTPPTPPTPTPTPTPTPRPRRPRPTPLPTPQLPETPPAGTRIRSLTVDPSSITLNGERSFRLTATLTPADASDKRLVWSSSDESVVRVRELPAEEMRRGLRAASSPTVILAEATIHNVGKAVITVKTTDGSNLTATCLVDVRALPTGNIEVTATRLYAAYGRLHLTLPTATAMHIYTVSGALVRTFLALAGTSSVALPRGVYVVRAGSITSKVAVD